MKIRKITTGYVIQVFDTKSKKWTSQEFTAIDHVDYENMDGKPISPKSKTFKFFEQHYLPFDMIQPDNECPNCGLKPTDTW